MIRTCASYLTTGVIMVTLVFGATVPRPVHADQAAVDVIAGASGCAAGAYLSLRLGALLSSIGLEVPAAEGADRLKNLALDCVAWVFNNILLEQITADIVGWINSGFDGNPAFVDSPNALFLDVGNELTGRFIEEQALEYLCSPFQVQIKLALLHAPSFEERSACTITDVIDNFESFIDGNFIEGGWEGWFHLTQFDENNPFGAYFEVQGELANRIARAIDDERQQLSFGKGFFTDKECVEYRTDLEGPPQDADCIQWQTKTPGSVIENQLNESVERPQRRIEVADEINEVIGALFTQLARQVIAGDGLRNVNPSDYVGTELPDIDPVIDVIDDATSGGGGGGFNLTCSSNGEPGSNTVVVDYPGPWSPPANGGSLRFNLGLDGHYTDATITFDVFMDGLLPEDERPIINGDRRDQQFVEVRHVADGFNGWFMYAGANAEETGIGAPGNRGNGPLNRTGGPLAEGQLYNVTINYDANAGTYTMVIRNANSGALVHDFIFPIANSIYPNEDSNVYLSFDAPRVQNTYNLSHQDAVYSNIRATFTPGEPVCGGASGGGNGGGFGGNS